GPLRPERVCGGLRQPRLLAVMHKYHYQLRDRTSTARVQILMHLCQESRMVLRMQISKMLACDLFHMVTLRCVCTSFLIRRPAQKSTPRLKHEYHGSRFHRSTTSGVIWLSTRVRV